MHLDCSGIGDGNRIGRIARIEEARVPVARVLLQDAGTGRGRLAAGTSRTGLAQAGLNAPLSAVGRCAANAKALLHRLHPYRDVVHRKIFFLFFPLFLFSALLIPFSFFLLFI